MRTYVCRAKVSSTGVQSKCFPWDQIIAMFIACPVFVGTLIPAISSSCILLDERHCLTPVGFAILERLTNDIMPERERFNGMVLSFATVSVDLNSTAHHRRPSPGLSVDLESFTDF